MWHSKFRTNAYLYREAEREEKMAVLAFVIVIVNILTYPKNNSMTLATTPRHQPQLKKLTTRQNITHQTYLFNAISNLAARTTEPKRPTNERKDKQTPTAKEATEDDDDKCMREWEREKEKHTKEPVSTFWLHKPLHLAEISKEHNKAVCQQYVLLSLLYSECAPLHPLHIAFFFGWYGDSVPLILILFCKICM